MRRVAALTVGQSPRPEMMAEINALAPGLEIIHAGAMDGVTDACGQKAITGVPLITRFRDGRSVLVDRHEARDRLQALIDGYGKQVDAVIVLCTEDFSSLKAPVPLILPFRIGGAFVASLGLTGPLGIICPLPEQVEWCRARWQFLALNPVVEAASPFEDGAMIRAGQTLARSSCQMIILDCASYGLEHARRLAKETGVPSLSLRSLTWSAVAEIFA